MSPGCSSYSWKKRPRLVSDSSCAIGITGFLNWPGLKRRRHRQLGRPVVSCPQALPIRAPLVLRVCPTQTFRLRRIQRQRTALPPLGQRLLREPKLLFDLGVPGQQYLLIGGVMPASIASRLVSATAPTPVRSAECAFVVAMCPVSCELSLLFQLSFNYTHSLDLSTQMSCT